MPFNRFFSAIYIFFKDVHLSDKIFPKEIKLLGRDFDFPNLIRLSINSFKSFNCSLFSILYGITDRMKLYTSSNFLQLQRYICLLKPVLLIRIFPLKYFLYKFNVFKLHILTAMLGETLKLLFTPVLFANLAHPSPSKCPAKYILICKGVFLYQIFNLGNMNILSLFAFIFIADLLLPVSFIIESTLPIGKYLMRQSISFLSHIVLFSLIYLCNINIIQKNQLCKNYFKKGDAKIPPTVKTVGFLFA